MTTREYAVLFSEQPSGTSRDRTAYACIRKYLSGDKTAAFNDIFDIHYFVIWMAEWSDFENVMLDTHQHIIGGRPVKSVRNRRRVESFQRKGRYA